MSVFACAWLALIVGGCVGAFVAKIHDALSIERVLFAQPPHALAHSTTFAVSSSYEPEQHGPRASPHITTTDEEI